MNTTDPYEDGTLWTVRSRKPRRGHHKAITLTLDWTLDLAARAATVRDFRTELGDLWRHYVDYEAPRVTAACHLPADTVPIRWYVRGQDKWGAIVLSEVAPQQFLTGDADQAAEDDILAHYEMPTNVGTGQPINWLRVPVADYSRVRARRRRARPAAPGVAARGVPGDGESAEAGAAGRGVLPGAAGRLIEGR
ncbi:hypothetical protein ACFQHO_52905 [Actinomadura yumaensis]|uniref:hypothetical protein n=1 Tax=Actinomadura yumaensis TaxID=111807 RepID=UPI0036120C90